MIKSILSLLLQADWYWALDKDSYAMCRELITILKFLQFEASSSHNSYASNIHTSDNTRDAIGEMRGSVHPTSSMMSRLSTLNLYSSIIGIDNTKASTLLTYCIARRLPRIVVPVLYWSSPCCGFSRAPCASLSTPLTNPPTREHLTEDTRGFAHSKRRKISSSFVPHIYTTLIIATRSDAQWPNPTPRKPSTANSTGMSQVRLPHTHHSMCHD